MPLIQKQIRFTNAFAILLCHAIKKGEEEGFYVFLEQGSRPWDADYGHPFSCHKYKLAEHLLLADLNKRWMTVTDPERAERIYRELHLFFESLGGAELIEGDLHHFSFAHQGVR